MRTTHTHTHTHTYEHTVVVVLLVLTCCPEAIPKQSRVCSIIYAEGAITHRRTIVRGFMTVDQTEYMHIVMAPEALISTGRPNKHYVGTTSGNAIMGVGSPDGEWKMTVAQKRTLFGPEARTVDFDPDSHKAKLVARDDSDIEPVHFWGMTHLLYEEIIHRLQAKAIIDLTATDVFAMTCIEVGIPYLGLCLTSQHVDALKRRLSASVFEKFTIEGNPLYKAKLAQTVDKLTTTTAENDDGGNPGPGKAKSKAKSKAKAGKKPSKAIAAAADDQNGNAEGDGEPVVLGKTDDEDDDPDVSGEGF